MRVATFSATVLILVCVATLLAVNRIRQRPGPPPPSRRTALDVPIAGEPLKLLEGARLVFGDPTSKYKVVEFFDFQCPPCRTLDGRIKSLLKANSNCALFVRNLPLPMHPYAMEAALSAEGAGRLGAYREFHDALISGPSDFSEAGFRRAATKAGLDLDRIRAESKTAEVKAQVAKDIAAANKLHLEATPSFILIEPTGRCLKLGSLGILTSLK